MLYDDAIVLDEPPPFPFPRYCSIVMNLFSQNNVYEGACIIDTNGTKEMIIRYMLE
jgi:hypothetical protein